MNAALVAEELTPDHAEITYRAATDVAVTAETAPQLRKLLDMLEDLDDVQNVYANVDQAALEHHVASL